PERVRRLARVVEQLRLLVAHALCRIEEMTKFTVGLLHPQEELDEPALEYLEASISGRSRVLELGDERQRSGAEIDVAIAGGSDADALTVASGRSLAREVVDRARGRAAETRIGVMAVQRREERRGPGMT